MSTIKTDTLQNVAGTKSVPVNTVVDGSAKAWVNFNGTGTVAIRAAFNVASIIDNGTGAYTVNFTTAMPDANYCAHVSASGGASASAPIAHLRWDAVAPTTSAAAVRTTSDVGTAADSPYITVTIFR